MRTVEGQQLRMLDEPQEEFGAARAGLEERNSRIAKEAYMLRENRQLEQLQRDTSRLALARSRLARASRVQRVFNGDKFIEGCPEGTPGCGRFVLCVSVCGLCGRSCMRECVRVQPCSVCALYLCGDTSVGTPKSLPCCRGRLLGSTNRAGAGNEHAHGQASEPAICVYKRGARAVSSGAQLAHAKSDLWNHKTAVRATRAAGRAARCHTSSMKSA